MGGYDDWTPAEQREWDRDLDEMWAKHEQTESVMYPENDENLHWIKLALDDPIFKVSYSKIGSTDLYRVDITQLEPEKQGVRNLDFEIVYPLYHGLNEIIETTKTPKTSQITVKVSSRKYREATYRCQFTPEQWSDNRMDEILEALADQLTMKQNLNTGLLMNVSFYEEE